MSHTRSRMKIRSILFASLAGLAAVAPKASAQVTSAPTTLSFTTPDTDLPKTLGYHVDFFQCGSISPQGLCVNQAGTPFQTGFDVPKAQVTTLSPVDQFGNNRSVSLTTAPASGVLPSLPNGVFFVPTVTATGDPTQGATNSPRSAAGNPFLENPAALTAPTGIRVK